MEQILNRNGDDFVHRSKLGFVSFLIFIILSNHILTMFFHSAFDLVIDNILGYSLRGYFYLMSKQLEKSENSVKLLI